MHCMLSTNFTHFKPSLDHGGLNVSIAITLGCTFASKKRFYRTLARRSVLVNIQIFGPFVRPNFYIAVPHVASNVLFFLQYDRANPIQRNLLLKQHIAQ